ncbi:MAG: single-stranded-DNA-specific exonuclease RecJ [Burkholderiales bacterium]|nr:single-stranded-DNA-specific exonuclease RecJ [Burkholderiales bacterium]
MSSIVIREVDAAARAQLLASGVHPLLARLYAARGIADAAQLKAEAARLIPPDRLLNNEKMAALLADAIAAGKKLLIVADYDADGATACAVGLRALRGFGAQVDYLVPNRFEYGYGLTPEIVRLAATQKKPDILITVDNGIASVEGVAEAARLGMDVLVTDHHLPGDVLPAARCIINPNQPGCSFPSKHLAGVGVMFYLMLALRAEFRRRGVYSEGKTEPNLSALLDLVALGTVADVVRLDDNNRILVHLGLQRMRAGRAHAGIAALFNAAGRDIRRAAAYDLGFVAGPRLNAAGRLDDMSLGIECLTTDDPIRAADIARQLDQLNRQRRNIESGMQDSALGAMEEIEPGFSLSLFDAQWHQGVIGILASRLRERFHRPTIAFAPAGNGEIKGSGRSIPALHLRDALDLVSKRQPGLILRFGGHAAAAGLSLREADFTAFSDAFENACRELLTPQDLQREWLSDGELETGELQLASAQCIAEEVWGQGFPEPRFHGEFTIASQRVVGERHLKLRLRREASPPGGRCEASPLGGRCEASPLGGSQRGQQLDAMLFGHAEPLPDKVIAGYRLSVNHYNGAVTLQLILDHWQPA